MTPAACDLQGPGKKWEHYELTANGKPVRQSMHVKAGDVVQVITGADKGKIGKISKVRLSIRARRESALPRGQSRQGERLSGSAGSCGGRLNYSEQLSEEAATAVS